MNNRTTELTDTKPDLYRKKMNHYNSFDAFLFQKVKKPCLIF